MEIIQEYGDFLTLIKAGLWDKKPSLQSDFNWDFIYKESQKQSVQGLIYDGINKLPNSEKPSKYFLLKWIGVIAKIEQSNKLLNSRLKEITSLYKSHNIPFVLLKGQGTALNYPIPNHRQCGDIDIYLGLDNYDIANLLLEKKGAVAGKLTTIKHLDFQWKGVTIENHRLISSFYKKGRNAFFQSWIKEWFPKKCIFLDIENEKVPVPPPLFDAIYLLHHILTHLFTKGIGLRQPIDWLLHIYKYRLELDKTEVKRLLEYYDLYKIAQAIAYIGVNYLGFSENELPIDVPNDGNNAQKLFKDILLSGNFGKDDIRNKKRPQGKYSGKFFAFYKAFRRVISLRSLSPSESWGILFLMIRNRLLLIRNEE